jgi:geranylgeranyl diphosphate synthase, type II
VSAPAPPVAGSPADLKALGHALAAVSAEVRRQIRPPLRDPLLYGLEGGGKRVRPLLCLMAYRAVRRLGRDDLAPAGIYHVAVSLELVHTYSLVHDDLPCMDDDDLRRGRPTLHRVHGAPLAVLAGAALLPLAIQSLVAGAEDLGLPQRTIREMVRALTRAAGAAGMVGGQLLDLEAESREISALELERIHRAKTGALLAASLRLGGLAAGAEAPALRALVRYGESLGLAFQIADDLLDLTGSDEVLGKTAGRDLSLEKATYPALFGVEGARTLAEERAEEAVDALEAEGLATEGLRTLARYVVERDR